MPAVHAEPGCPDGVLSGRKQLPGPGGLASVCLLYHPYPVLHQGQEPVLPAFGRTDSDQQGDDDFPGRYYGENEVPAQGRFLRMLQIIPGRDPIPEQEIKRPVNVVFTGLSM